ncbi:Arc family DNA-binding protein [Azotobacter salinestris]|uniref:Arc family DNA-binding protein n=1 Tax=Azotobacter salinestris TaxID=69964 RepID=UPI0032DE35D8
MDSTQKKINPIQVRLPEEMKERIEKAAKASFRSAHGEILYRLNLLDQLEAQGKVVV